MFDGLEAFKAFESYIVGGELIHGGMRYEKFMSTIALDVILADLLVEARPPT